MNLRSPLARVRGSGSAMHGTSHWWQQKLTAIALVPLSIWFVASVVSLAGSHYERFQAWLAVPGNTTLMLLLLYCAFLHSQLGLQVVIEDYVGGRGAKVAATILVKLINVLLGVFAGVSVLRTALVGG